MYSDLLMKDFESYLPALTKTPEFAFAQFEKLTAFQFDALQSYMQLGLDQWQAMLSIHDSDSLHDFWTSQLDTTVRFSQKVLQDSQALNEMLLAMSSQFSQLTKENPKPVNQPATSTAAATASTTEKPVSTTPKTARKLA